MTQDAEGFLARWSRRKARAREAVPASQVPGQPAAAEPPTGAGEAAVSGAAPSSTSEAGATPQAPTAAALPSLQDVAQLTPASDFAPFVAREVDPSVRNAALRKLFTDPHFNVMDGLDVYIDDYGKPDPLPASLLRQMVQSRALGLFDEPESRSDGAGGDPAAAVPGPLPAESRTLPAERQPDEDPDLRLQPHPPAEVGGDDGDPGAGAAAHPGGERGGS